MRTAPRGAVLDSGTLHQPPPGIRMAPAAGTGGRPMTPEQRRAYNKAWHKANREQILTRQRRYYRENQERIKEKRRQHYRAQKGAKPEAAE